MPQIPTPKKPHWILRNFWVELFFATIAFSTSLFAAIAQFEKDKVFSWTLSAMIVTTFSVFIVGLLKTVRASVQDGDNEEHRHPRDLSGCLTVMLHAMDAFVGDTIVQKAQIRATIFNVNKQSKTLEQVVPYAGCQLDNCGRPGRTIPTSQGVVGLCARSGEVQRVNRNDLPYEDFCRDMINSWGYDSESVRNIRPDRLAWMGVPLFGKAERSEVIGVVFIDASDAAIFADDEFAHAITMLCEGIAIYVHDRYGGVK